MISTPEKNGGPGRARPARRLDFLSGKLIDAVKDDYAGGRGWLPILAAYDPDRGLVVFEISFERIGDFNLAFAHVDVLRIREKDVALVCAGTN